MRNVELPLKLLWPSLLVLSLASLVAGFRSVQGRDSAVFMYIAQQALGGTLPYQDLWDHKPPGIYVVDALGLLLTGDARGVWLLEFVSFAAAVGCCFLAVRKIFGSGSAMFGTCLLLLSFPLVLDGGNLTEEFGLSTEFAALYLYSRTADRDNSLRSWLLIGLLGGFAVLLKPNLVGLWIAFGLLSVLRALRARSGGGLWSLIGLSLGVLTPVTLACIYFALRGGLVSLVDAVITYNYWYSHYVIWIDRWKALVAGLSILSGSFLTPFAIVGWVLAVTLLSLGRSRPDCPPALIIGIVWLPVELVFALISGRDYPHYFIPWLPVMALLAATAVWAMQRLFNYRLGRVPTGFAVALFIVLIAAVPPAARRAREAFAEPAAYALTRAAVVSYIDLTTRPDDRVLVWGAETSIYLETERRSPTRYIYIYPLYTRGYQTVERIRELLADLTRTPPIVIVDASAAAIEVVPPLDRQQRSLWTPSDATYAGLPEMDQVFDFIYTNYVATAQLGPSGWAVYRHR